MWRVKYKGKISPEKYVLEEIDLKFIGPCIILIVE
jgi:hypothetical protein